MSKRIEMNYKKEDSTYEVLYPQTQVENITDFLSYMEENYYTRSECEGIFTTVSGTTKIETNVTVSSGSFSVPIDTNVKAVQANGYHNGGNTAASHTYSVFTIKGDTHVSISLGESFSTNQTGYSLLATVTWWNDRVEIIARSNDLVGGIGQAILFY